MHAQRERVRKLLLSVIYSRPATTAASEGRKVFVWTNSTSSRIYWAVVPSTKRNRSIDVCTPAQVKKDASICCVILRTLSLPSSPKGLSPHWYRNWKRRVRRENRRGEKVSSASIVRGKLLVWSFGRSFSRSKLCFAHGTTFLSSPKIVVHSFN